MKVTAILLFAACTPSSGFLFEETAPDVNQVAAGSRHTCALDIDGRTTCWGAGVGSSPSDVFLRITAGANHNVGFRVDGTLKCWAARESEVVNDECAVPAGRFRQIDAADGQTCAIRDVGDEGEEGTIVCWGPNAQPALVPSGKFTQISVADSRSCGLREDGAVVCWGGTPIPTAPTGNFMQVGAGEWPCALRPSGEVVCWGGNAITPSGSTFDVIFRGGDSACGIELNTRSISCWGAYLGATPVGRYNMMSIGDAHACAITADYAVECWGDATTGATDVPDFMH